MHAHIQLYMHTYSYTCTHTVIHAHIQLYMHTYSYTCTHTVIHMYFHQCMHTFIPCAVCTIQCPKIWCLHYPMCSLHYPMSKDLMRKISEAYADDVKKKAVRGFRRPGEDSLTLEGKIQVHRYMHTETDTNRTDMLKFIAIGCIEAATCTAIHTFIIHTCIYTCVQHAHSNQMHRSCRICRYSYIHNTYIHIYMHTTCT
jgi:hypothetical protein